MKYKIIFITTTLTLLTFSFLFSQIPLPPDPPIEDKSIPHEELWEMFPRSKFSHKRKFEFDQRIKNAVEDGIISQQQADELLKLKKEVEDYHKNIWSDDKMTKEEKEKAEQLRKTFQQKVHEVLETAIKNWREKQDKSVMFDRHIDRALKNGKITQQQADELKKTKQQLDQLEKDIWSDDVMTKEELKKLLQAKKDFHKKISSMFHWDKNKFRKQKKI